MLGTALTCREELDNITNSIKYVVWPIFSDVKKYFTAQMFHIIGAKSLWEEIVKEIEGKPLMKIAHDETMMAKIHQVMYDFDYIRKAIEKQCEEWRVTFPRLFVMTDEKLIDFMEDFPKSKGLQEIFHFSCLNLYQDKEIRGVQSEKGEELRLIHPVKVCKTCSPAEALRKLEKSMRESMKEEIMQAMKTRTAKKEWYIMHLSQAVCVALWVEWTRSIEEALKGNDVHNGLQHCLELYQTEMKTVLQTFYDKKEECQTKITNIVFTLHAMVTILEELVRNKVAVQNSPFWANKLKFYWKNDTIIIKCEDNIVEYGYEFYGCSKLSVYFNEGRNLANPLIMSSFKHLIMAGLTGPVGCGKTDTIQNMAIILGKPHFVYNCGPEMKMEALENATRAVGYCGGILIADELNRMQDEKKTMELWAKLLEFREAGCKELVEEGRRIKLCKNYTVVATVSPGFEKMLGYLTTAVLVIPDIKTICEGFFYLEGFVNAKDLSDVMTKCITEMKNKLSTAKQYDFGPRLVRNLITLTKYLMIHYNLSEQEAIPQAFHELVWPRLEKGDLKLYEETMKSIFGANAAMKILNLALLKVLADNPAKIPEQYVYACCFMHDLMQCNKSIMMIAPDDRAVHYLADAITKIYPAEIPIIMNVDMNVPAEQAFGKFQLENETWIPGTVGKLIYSLDDSKCNWLVFKGELDTKIESIYGMLDTSKTYTSANGYMRKLNERTKIILVTPNVDKLSPGLISLTIPFKFT